MKRSKIRLGLNIDHIATLRQVRAASTDYPNLIEHAVRSVAAGADQITVHLREDRRHIQDQDVIKLCQLRPTVINLEMAVTPEMVRFAKKHKPDWCCFVPEKRNELTTEGGLDVVRAKSKIARAIEALQDCGIEVSLFIEPSKEQIKASFEVGADAVEFHTGTWVLAQGLRKKTQWKKLKEAAHYAASLSLGVHAGHGLDYKHAEEVRKLPFLREVNIGHSLICYALEEGLSVAIKKMKSKLKK